MLDTVLVVGLALDRDADHGQLSGDEGDGAVFHFAGGVAFGVDVADLLQLEGAFEGARVIVAPAQEQGIERVEVFRVLRAVDDVFLIVEDPLELVRNGAEFGDHLAGFFFRDAAAGLAQPDGEQGEAGHL